MHNKWGSRESIKYVSYIPFEMEEAQSEYSIQINDPLRKSEFISNLEGKNPEITAASISKWHRAAWWFNAPINFFFNQQRMNISVKIAK